MMRPVGIEPTASALKERRSLALVKAPLTTELRAPMTNFIGVVAKPALGSGALNERGR